MNVVSWPRHPPGCTCGCQPECGPAWSQEAIDCYNQIARFRRMVQQVISEMGLAPGVTNGSDARPGQVGEFVEHVAKGTFPAQETTQIVNSLVVMPGDWDVMASLYLGPIGQAPTFITYGTFDLVKPLPAGLSGDLFGYWGQSEPAAAAGVTGVFGMTLQSNRVRASLSVPTLLAFEMTTQLPATFPGQTTGSYTLTVNARRMR